MPTTKSPTKSVSKKPVKKTNYDTRTVFIRLSENKDGIEDYTGTTYTEALKYWSLKKM